MDIPRLIGLATRYATEESGGIRDLPSLSVYFRDAESKIEAVICEPIICLTLQGSKVTSIGDQHVVMEPGGAVIVSHDLPVVSRITKASHREPYIAVVLMLDMGLVRNIFELVAESPAQGDDARSLAAGPADPAWLAPLERYFELMDSPLDAKVLGPSILREIHYRLVLSPIGGMLRHLLYADSNASRVAKAILKLRAEFRSPLAVADLAKAAGMSASSFHEHFKSVTGTTPLQFQKDLRLIEAHALLVNRNHTVSEAAYAVGYESPTHFSRDYSRKFGLPPSREKRASGDVAAE